jgi:hypothetical protein
VAWRIRGSRLEISYVVGPGWFVREDAETRTRGVIMRACVKGSRDAELNECLMGDVDVLSIQSGPSDDR